MRKRLSTAVDVAACAALVSSGWGWLVTREAVPWILASGLAGAGALALAILVALLPGLGADGGLGRPWTFVYPLIHVSISAMLSQAAVTQPYSLVVMPEPLAPVGIWQRPLDLAAIYVGQVIVLDAMRWVSLRRSAR